MGIKQWATNPSQGRPTKSRMGPTQSRAGPTQSMSYQSSPGQDQPNPGWGHRQPCCSLYLKYKIQYIWTNEYQICYYFILLSLPNDNTLIVNVILIANWKNMMIFGRIFHNQLTKSGSPKMGLGPAACFLEGGHGHPEVWEFAPMESRAILWPI